MGLPGKVLFTDRKTGMENEHTLTESALLWTLTNGQSLWSNLELQALVVGTVIKVDANTSSFPLLGYKPHAFGFPSQISILQPPYLGTNIFLVYELDNF